MRLRQLISEQPVDNEQAHWDAYDQTGYYGKGGAGCIFFAQNTKLFGIAHRSREVNEPNTFGTTGGALDGGERPEQGVVREVAEEIGYAGPHKLVPLDVFKDKTFTYTTFVMIVPRQFTARPNWEVQAFNWYPYGKWPSPLHPGLAATLAKPDAQKVLERLAGKG